MIKIEKLTPNQIQQAGFNVLAKNLGVIGFVKFIQQFDLGAGDYTKQRQATQRKLKVKNILSQI